MVFKIDGVYNSLQEAQTSTEIYLGLSSRSSVRNGDRRFSRTLRDDFRCSRSIDFYRLPTSILNDRYIAANIEKTYQVI